MTNTKLSAYEAPAITVLGKVELLTLGCDKRDGSSDGFTYHGVIVVCASS